MTPAGSLLFQILGAASYENAYCIDSDLMVFLLLFLFYFYLNLGNNLKHNTTAKSACHKTKDIIKTPLNEKNCKTFCKIITIAILQDKKLISISYCPLN